MKLTNVLDDVRAFNNRFVTECFRALFASSAGTKTRGRDYSKLEQPGLEPIEKYSRLLMNDLSLSTIDGQSHRATMSDDVAS